VKARNRILILRPALNVYIDRETVVWPYHPQRSRMMARNRFSMGSYAENVYIDRESIDLPH